MLIKHLRDDERRPFGTIVCEKLMHNGDPTPQFMVGISICCPRDPFNKPRGIKIAMDRAVRGITGQSPNRTVMFCGEKMLIEKVVQTEYYMMLERAKSYYKEENNV